MTKRKWDDCPKINGDISFPKPKKVPEKTQPGSSKEPTFHVLQIIAAKIGAAPDFLKLSAVNSRCKTVVGKEVSKHRQGLVVDVSEFNKTKLLFSSKWYSREMTNEFHNDVREMVRLLSAFTEAVSTGNNSLVNFSPHSLGWQYSDLEDQMKRCPLLLQKKIAKLVKEHFNKTTEFTYHKSFLRPSRFVQMFKHRLETVTVLDLGDMKALSAVSLRRNIFPGLSNLRELVWHSAETWFIEALPAPHKLKSLCITLTIKAAREELLNLLLNCQGLESLHTGVHRPPMNRLVWTVVLRAYQAFWNQRRYVPDNLLGDKGTVPAPIAKGKESDFVYRAFPVLERISFWDTPEYLLVIMAKERISYKEVQLGLLTQDLQSLCSLDSVMQALFKFMQPENVNPLFIDHLKLNTHSMPVVTLDYYLPNLMDGLGTTLPRLQTLDLFVHCLVAGSAMPSSWSLEKSRRNKAKPKFESLLKFSFHIDGYCVLDDLDTYLPPSIQSISLSFIQPREHRRKFLASLLRFIERLGDINRFPDLDELNIQVWGMSCFEPVANAVVDHLPSLKRLSIITLPVSKEISSIKELIGHVAKSSPHLVEFGLSSEMIALLISEEDKKSHWRDVLFKVGESCGITNECALSVRKLPQIEGWNRYTVQPVHISEDELTDSDEEMSTEEGEKEDTSGEEEEEEGSFVVEADEGAAEGSEDELDEVERALEREDERSHRRWQKKRARIVSESSEKSEDNEDVVVFRRRRPGQIISDEEEEDGDEEEEERNPFVDDEAEEGSEESEEDETEPEGEDLAQSDDDRLLEAQAQLVNARPRRNYAPKKPRRICESDSD